MRDLHKLVTVFVLVSILIVPASTLASTNQLDTTTNSVTKKDLNYKISKDGNNFEVGKIHEVRSSASASITSYITTFSIASQITTLSTTSQISTSSNSSHISNSLNSSQISTSSNTNTSSSSLESATCGISFISGSIIDYQDLYPNDISAEKTLEIQNTGTNAADLLVSGQDWKDDGGETVIMVDKTKFSTTSNAYNAKNELSGTLIEIIDLLEFTPGATKDTFWQTQVMLEESTFVGDLTQQVYFVSMC